MLLPFAVKAAEVLMGKLRLGRSRLCHGADRVHGAWASITMDSENCGKTCKAVASTICRLADGLWLHTRGFCAFKEQRIRCMGEKPAASSRP